MTSPFDDLYEPVTATPPDPDFARRLRARVERALALPKGVVPVTATPDRPVTTSAAVPYLAVTDARAAIDWYADVFGATVVGEPITMPDGRIGHAELALGAGVLYLADESPDLGVVAPVPGAAAVSLMLPVDDADRVRGRAIDRGADGSRPPYDGYGERHAWIVDPFGHRWGLTSPLRAAAGVDFAPRHGDLAYASLWVPNVEQAQDFYRAVLGWTYDDRGRVQDAAAHTGFYSGRGRPTLFCCWAVDDLEAARDRVLEAGGSVGTIADEPFGRVVDCVDSEGTRFALWATDPDATGPRPPVNGNGPGDLSYLTLHVGDSARAREFYGAVLDWTFSPGRVEDGWGVEGTAPMTGLAGGQEHATAVPQWLVTDIDVAVAAVRAHGGTATDPERQPYGLSAVCTDDQGLAFYLGQA